MTPDTRIAKSFNILFTDYQMLLGYEAIGLYYHLIWLHSRSLGKPVTKEYILAKTFLTEENLLNMLKRLGVFKLVSRARVENENGKEWEFTVDNPKYISTQDKYDLVEKMYNKVLINDVERDRLFEYIKDTAVNEKKQEEDKTTINHLTKDKDFSEGLIEINPDTPMGLTLYYYKKLGETFGGKYTSRNIRMESAHIGECIRKNEDSPELTRQFIDWILKKAKGKGQFEKVSSLGLYPEYRKHAYHAICVQEVGDKKFEEKVDDTPKEEKILKNIRGVYDIYIGQGMSREQAIEKLNANFGAEDVSKSLEVVNAE